jgi:hypothetical protein
MSRVRNRLKRIRPELEQFRVRLGAWIGFRRHRHRYRILDEQELLGTRKSDTVFIFGSGASLNEIDAREWAAMSRHDTIGFNWFVRQNFIRCDYHVIREIGSTDVDPMVWRPLITEYFQLLAGNPRFVDTVLLVQTGFRATNGNRAIGLGLIPPSRRIVLWRSLRDRAEPSPSLHEGLAHGHGTLQECVNFAYLMGWRKIVLAGIDLYDRGYFWLPPGQPGRGDASTAEPHRTASTGVVDALGQWRQRFLADGVELFVQNPRSLLARTLPVWPGAEVAAH